MKEARQRYETRLVEVDSGRKQEYEYKLTEGLAEMRAQNEEQIQLYKDSMDSTYQTKVGTHSVITPLCGGVAESPCVVMCSDYFYDNLEMHMKLTAQHNSILSQAIRNGFDAGGPPIPLILHMSAAVGSDPSCFKHAVVQPLLKKPTLTPNALRTFKFSLKLLFLSKLLEKVA